MVVCVCSEKAMAPHSSTLAWKIPWTEEPGRLQSMGSLRVGHDWATSLSLFTFMHWRKKWQPTPVFLPGESQGRGSLVGCRLWGHIESDATYVKRLSSSSSSSSSSICVLIPNFWFIPPHLSPLVTINLFLKSVHACVCMCVCVRAHVCGGLWEFFLCLSVCCPFWLL